MTKGVKICLAAVLVILTVSVILTVRLLTPTKKDASEGSVWVEIVQDGKTIYKLDLSQEDDYTFRIECAEGWNDITIKNGTICVSDADCPDHTCVKNGVLRYDYLPIICLPHKLSIRFCEPEDSDDYKKTY